MQRREPDASGSLARWHLALDMFLCLESCLLVLSLSPQHLDKSGVSQDRREGSVMMLSWDMKCYYVFWTYLHCPLPSKVAPPPGFCALNSDLTDASLTSTFNSPFPTRRESLRNNYSKPQHFTHQRTAWLHYLPTETPCSTWKV